MARNAWIFKSRPMSFLDEGVAVADTAGFDFNANLPPSWLRGGPFDDFEIASRLADLHGFHVISFLVRCMIKRSAASSEIFAVAEYEFCHVDKK
jgi:hypothetical protein